MIGFGLCWSVWLLRALLLCILLLLVFKSVQLIVVFTGIVFCAGVENLLAESATNHAISHIQLGFSDTKQGVAMGAFGLHGETLAQSGARLILLIMLVEADLK